MRSERKNKKWGGRKDTKGDEMKMLGDGDAKGGGEGGWGREEEQGE